MTDETIEVTLKLPKPPEGYGEPEHRFAVAGDVVWTGEKWHLVQMYETWNRGYFCCRRIDDPWKPPAGAADGTTFFPDGDLYYVTSGLIDRRRPTTVDYYAINKDAALATIFRDFVTPPLRRPYTVGKDC